jgi:hypothetical protein
MSISNVLQLPPGPFEPLIAHEGRIGRSRGLEQHLHIARADAVARGHRGHAETVKGAEDGRGFIVRLYESQRRRGPITLASGLPLARAFPTKLLEEDETELEVQENAVSLELRPYEIATVRLVPGL